MKTKNILFFLFTILLMGNSCSSSEHIGCGEEEKIGLGKKTLNISGTKNTSVVKTESGNWCIDKVEVIDESGERAYLNEFYIFNNGKNDSYNRYKDTLSYDWFTVSKSQLNFKEIIIEVDDNNSGNSRYLNIYLGSFPSKLYGEILKISQEAKN
jgi:hypothetical protein